MRRQTRSLGCSTGALLPSPSTFSTAQCCQRPGKALIVRQVRINTFENPTPGTGNNVILWVGTGGCDQLVGDVNPASIGLDTVTFDPGLGIPAGSKLFAYKQGGVSAERTPTPHSRSAQSGQNIAGFVCEGQPALS